FPIQNLPFGVFRPHAGGPPRVGVAIGETIVDLSVLERRMLLNVPDAAGGARNLFNRTSLNVFMSCGRDVWREVRQSLSQLLRHDEPRLRDDALLRREALVPMADAEMLLPVEIGDYTDFYSSREHATNVGAMLRGPENALMPNWLHLPVAYHGRASSIVVSGADLCRPCGQTKADNAAAPSFGPSRAVDFELEMGIFIGPGNAIGEAIPVGRAAEHIFGLVLVNDWSARDIQKWEYVPLGPFLAKNFGTSISPWVVPLEALEPFRAAGPHQDPPPLPYLFTQRNEAYDIRLEVWLEPGGGHEPTRVCASNLRHLYWNFCQQIAHHTSNGCNLRTGDLLATGTISGPTPDSRGCLLELTSAGRKPLVLAGGQTRAYLDDGDRVTMTGWCQGNGYRVGFGEVTGRLLPAGSAASGTSGAED
ncbi:MAG TPA: fumarylacetoacetase, partial [Planctomycetaceae bacterium]|nr:fumarylacetoacetase [Planctomycetaceae bacterium]